MKLTRLITPAATTAALAAAALALAPAASATGHHTSHSHSAHNHAAAYGHRTAHHSSTTSLPAAAKVFPTPGKQVSITPASTSTSPGSASLDWTIPACRGTVYASFILKQGPNVYLHDRGSASTYTCQSTPQTVTVTYSPADPSQGPLSTGQVSVTTTTKPAATGSGTYQTRTSTLPAALKTPALPPAAAVHPSPAAQQVAITVTGQRYSPAYATLDWTLPACTGTIYAYFQLDQAQATGTQTYVQEKGSTAYPCTSTPQTLHVKYHPVDPSARALTAGNVDLTATTYAAATGSQVTSTSKYTLLGVLSPQGS